MLRHQSIDGDGFLVSAPKGKIPQKKFDTKNEYQCRPCGEFVHIASVELRAGFAYFGSRKRILKRTPYSFETLDSVVRLIA